MGMPPTERTMPLFPLNTVLFPNATLPLQIFEERYKLMLQNCLENDSRFGVILIKSGREVGEPAVPHTIGTVAEITQVNRIEDGKIFISVRGERRFHVKNIVQFRPFLVAEIEYLDDDSIEDVSSSVVEAVRESVSRYFSLMLGMRGGWTREARVPSEPVRLSFFIAEILQVGLGEKQMLLEESSVSKRLEIALDLLIQEAEALKLRVSQELRRRFGRH